VNRVFHNNTELHNQCESDLDAMRTGMGGWNQLRDADVQTQHHHGMGFEQNVTIQPDKKNEANSDTSNDKTNDVTDVFIPLARVQSTESTINL